MDHLSLAVISSWIAVRLIEFLKRWSATPWITQATGTLNRVLGAIIAAAAAVGITFQFDPTAGTLLISGLSLTAMITFGLNWLVQFFLQQTFYHAVVKDTDGAGFRRRA